MWRVLILATAVAGSAYADDPFECVDPDVASAFVGHLYGGGASYSTSIPDSFVELNVPGELSLVGSQSMNSHTSVVFKSKWPADKAMEAVVEEMGKLGWVEEHNPYQRTSGGFQTSSRPAFVMICNNDKQASLTVMAAEKADNSFVSVVSYPKNGGCGLNQTSQRQNDPAAMMALLPRMILPDFAVVTNSGSSGGSYEVSSHVDVSGGIGRAELASIFESQMREQGWESQTSWSSLYSSGSVWALDSEDYGLLIGTLHLIEPDSESIRVRFSITPANSGHGSANSSWSLN